MVVVLWNYTGLSAEEMEQRVSTVFERNLTTTVNDIEHTESQTYNGKSIIKIFFHPNVKVEMAVAQITRSQGASAVRFMPPRHHTALHLRLPRLQRTHHPARPFRQGTQRAAIVRLRHQQYPHRTCHRTRRVDPLSLWRQAAPGNDRHPSL